MPFSSDLLQNEDDDCNLPDEWIDKTTIEGWAGDNTLPEGWTPKHNCNSDDTTLPGLDDVRDQPIQAIIGNRCEGWNKNKQLPAGWRATTTNTTVKRDNRTILASQLPTIFATNHRSFFPKFQNFLDLMQTQGLTLGLHSEIWESKENKDHQKRIEEAFELEGVQYISNPRPNRGGGAAITLLCSDFTLSKLDVVIPKNLEVVWGLVRPNVPTPEFKGIIVCSFYSVPNSRRKGQLIEHITINYTQLKAGNRDCFFLVGGDKNELDVRHILDISPNLHMHNTKPTYGQKNIDILISDMVHLYNESVILPSVPTDIPPGRPGGGQPSDHSVVMCRPRLERLSKPAKETITKKTRRVDDAKKMKIGQWIQQESWETVVNCKSSSQMASQFTKLVFEKLTKYVLRSI